ncbi:MAG: regulatory iron-sulfur-containing complex subunit RicT [Planctomycetota bacterium]
MPIHPLPQFEADLAELEAEDRAAYERLKPPETVVVRFGSMKMIGEFPFREDVKPGCGTKLVVQTHRGLELGELLTSTCPNAGCSKSVTRNEMLEYIERSGGRDYPFHKKGRVVRIASKEDLDRQADLEQRKQAMKLRARQAAARLDLPIRVVEAEPILGGDRVILHYALINDDPHLIRPDLRPLTQSLAEAFEAKVDTHTVGARDEARLSADYERCGQYCCCKNFLKVLKPVSMRSAKVQKATLDPLKISGRCGRLMCCLRYEDETYTELKKRLPNRKKRVGTPHGDGIVLDTQILTQLVKIRLDNDEEVAVTVEELTEPEHATAPPPPPPPLPREPRKSTGKPSRDRGPRREKAPRDNRGSSPAEADEAAPKKKKKRRRKKKPVDPAAESRRDPEATDGPTSDAAKGKKKKKRRRRKKSKGDEGGGGGEGPSDSGPSSD